MCADCYGKALIVALNVVLDVSSTNKKSTMRHVLYLVLFPAFELT